MLRGIIPIMLTPFMPDGSIDAESLRRLVQFELSGDIDAIGVCGFASEAYKMTDAERFQCAQIVAEAVNGAVPLVIGIAPGSTESAIQQSAQYAALAPAALMTLPPSTMSNSAQALVDHYVALAEASSIPIMVQQSPHLQGYAGTLLSAEHLAEMAQRAANIRYFKIEGTGSPERISALKPLLPNGVALFGGVGGIALKDELRAGANGLLPGVGFNEVFVQVWRAWQAGDNVEVETLLRTAQPLVEAVSGSGHEYSLHARKRLLKRAGIITDAYVRRPTVEIDEDALLKFDALVDRYDLRVMRWH
jgi:2-keto-3-deoxy-L-arabinonate dehydratase